MRAFGIGLPLAAELRRGHWNVLLWARLGDACLLSQPPVSGPRPAIPAGVTNSAIRAYSMCASPRRTHTPKPTRLHTGLGVNKESHVRLTLLSLVRITGVIVNSHCLMNARTDVSLRPESQNGGTMKASHLIAVVAALAIAGCGQKNETCKSKRQLKCPCSGAAKTAAKPRLIVELPDNANTPDGCTLDAQGNIILSIPNFNNGALMKQGVITEESPAFMSMIDKDNKFSTWYEFKEEDLHPDTKKVGPMDCAFGPDGNLYIADNQLFFDPNHKSRILRINMKDGKPVDCDVVVEGFICSNGMDWKGDKLYVSETILVHAPKVEEGQPKPKLISGVYEFALEEMAAGIVKLKPYEKGDADPRLVAEYESSNSTGFGADGVAIDGEGNMYCGIFEDGIIYKTTFDADGKPNPPTVFAQDPKMPCSDGIVWRKEDNKIYNTDMLHNGVEVIDMEGNVTVLHKNGDTDGADGSLDQPCEVLVRGNELIVISMDMPWESDTLRNTKIDKPYTVSAISLE